MASQTFGFDLDAISEGTLKKSKIGGSLSTAKANLKSNVLNDSTYGMYLLLCSLVISTNRKDRASNIGLEKSYAVDDLHYVPKLIIPFE